MSVRCWWGRGAPRDVASVWMIRRWIPLGLAWAAACRSPSGAIDPAVGDPSSAALAVDREGPPSQVQITWRLFETLHWLDGEGPHQSAIFELIVDGGTPSRVQLGRRESSGCLVRPEDDGGPGLASLDCSFALARLVRASRGELYVEAFDIDAGHPDREPRRGLQTATVRIPIDASVAVSRELARIPDEAVPGTSVR